MSGGVVECHLRLGLVVGSYHEGDDGELSKTGSHGQDLGERGVYGVFMLGWYTLMREENKIGVTAGKVAL